MSECGCECKCGSDDLARKTSGKHGHATKCRACTCVEQAAYRATDRGKQVKAENRARPGQQEKARARTEAWRDRYPGRNAATVAAWREEYPERTAAALQRWYRANPDAVRAARLRRKAHKNASTCETATRAQVREIVGNCCANCGAQGEHVDHIWPLSRGGCGNIHNLQMLCAKCNLSKGAKTMLEWLGT